MAKVFKLNSKNAKRKAVERKQKGQKRDYHKLEATKTLWGILPPTTDDDDNDLIVDIYKYDVWNSKKEKIGSTGSPQKGTDVIKEIISNLYNIVNDAENDDDSQYSAKQVKSLKNIISNFRLKKETYVNAVNIQAPKDGVRLLKLPKKASEAVTDRICTKGLAFCDPEKGNIFKIEHNGGKRFDKEYTAAVFLKKPATLVKILDEEVLLQQCVDLRTVQPKYNQTEYEKIRKALFDQLEKMDINPESIINEDEVIEVEDEETELELDDSGDDDLELDDEGEDESDDIDSDLELDDEGDDDDDLNLEGDDDDDDLSLEEDDDDLSLDEDDNEEEKERLEEEITKYTKLAKKFKKAKNAKKLNACIKKIKELKAELANL